MRRREFLQTGAALAGVGLGLVAGTASGHPGPYRPYGRVEIPGCTEAVVGDDGHTVYVAARTGYVVVDVAAPDRPRVLADRRELLADREDGPLRGIQDVSVDGDWLLVAGPANPTPNALAGVLLVDVSDPSDPIERAFFETSYPIHNCQLRDGIAYLTGNDGDRNPLVLVDVRGDGPREVGRWSLVDAVPDWSSVPSRVRPLHDVRVRDGVAALAHWDAGTWLVDVSDPAAPVAIGSVDADDPAAVRRRAGEDGRREGLAPPGNHHYAATDERGTLLAVGKESWAYENSDGRVVGGPSGIDLWDVRDPSSPAFLATIPPPPTPDGTLGGVWTTAHNFELRDGTLYSAWYQGGVRRHDVSDPAAPREETWWREPDLTRFWTARVAEADDTRLFVASSVGTREGPAALYTFPDHAGTQADPPSLAGDRPGSGNQSTAGGSTGSDTGGTVAGSGGSTADRGDSTPATTDPGVATTDREASGSAAPGFGLAAGAAALGGVAWWLDRRRRERP
jgi:hypothetical protein